jgi:hypothetical protein
MTKSLLSSAIGVRVAEGKLSLDDFVEWQNGTSSSQLTVSHLLRMVLQSPFFPSALLLL